MKAGTAMECKRKRSGAETLDSLFLAPDEPGLEPGPRRCIQCRPVRREINHAFRLGALLKTVCCNPMAGYGLALGCV